MYNNLDFWFWALETGNWQHIEQWLPFIYGLEFRINGKIRTEQSKLIDKSVISCAVKSEK